MKNITRQILTSYCVTGSVFVFACIFPLTIATKVAHAAAPDESFVQSFEPMPLALPRHPATRSNDDRPALDRGPSWRARIGDDLQAELRCLALNIYFEARSEPRIGMLAVAAVTLNRVSDPMFPDSVCEVVWQNADAGHNRCQFSWACDGRSDEPENARAWRAASNLARMMLAYELADPTAGALWYHADYVEPKWARAKTVVARIGRHIYYRAPFSVERRYRGAS